MGDEDANCCYGCNAHVGSKMRIVGEKEDIAMCDDCGIGHADFIPNLHLYRQEGIVFIIALNTPKKGWQARLFETNTLEMYQFIRSVQGVDKKMKATYKHLTMQLYQLIREGVYEPGRLKRGDANYELDDEGDPVELARDASAMTIYNSYLSEQPSDVPAKHHTISRLWYHILADHYDRDEWANYAYYHETASTAFQTTALQLDPANSSEFENTISIEVKFECAVLNAIRGQSIEHKDITPLIIQFLGPQYAFGQSGVRLTLVDNQKAEDIHPLRTLKRYADGFAEADRALKRQKREDDLSILK